MPEILPIGWFHTGVAIIAIFAGIMALKKHTLIAATQIEGKVFLICTVLAAVTALMIFQRGAFGPGHALAVLTLVAVAAGLVAEKTAFLGKFAPYLQAAAYSAIFLFHMIPAITDGLMRLPVGHPIVTDFADPLLRGFYLFFLICYVIGLGLQWRGIKAHTSAMRGPATH